MHELSICHSIAKIVTRHAAERPVQTVHLRVGHLRQVVPDTLVHCWSLVVEDTPLEGSELRVESVPTRIRCAECGCLETLTAPILRCGGCQSTVVSIVAGEEFLITSLELAEA